MPFIHICIHILCAPSRKEECHFAFQCQINLVNKKRATTTAATIAVSFQFWIHLHLLCAVHRHTEKQASSKQFVITGIMQLKSTIFSSSFCVNKMLFSLNLIFSFDISLHNRKWCARDKFCTVTTNRCCLAHSLL